MANQFQISKLFENAFGYKPENGRFNIERAPERTERSQLGQPMWEDDIYGREFFMPVTFYVPTKTNAGTLALPYKVPFAVVSINCRKTIVETALVERRGTVKELINTEDYDINIKGLIVREDNEWPEDEIIDLEKLFAVNQSIALRSALTDIFLKGDYEHKVVVKSISLPSNPGIENAKPFEMNCTSDAIFTLEVE